MFQTGLLRRPLTEFTMVHCCVVPARISMRHST